MMPVNMNGHGQPPFYRSKTWDTHDIEQYCGVHPFIIDDKQPDARAGDSRSGNQVMHGESCDEISDFYSDYLFCCKPYRQNISQHATQGEVYNSISKFLATKTKDDLVIASYIGKAEGVNEDWTWITRNGLRLNGLKMLHLFMRSAADVLLLFDGWIQSRFVPPLRRKHAMMEIIAMPAGPYHSATGERLPHNGDLLVSMLRNLRAYANDLANQEDITDHYAATTIPKLMTTGKEMYSNPLRIWTARPKPTSDPSTEPRIWRFFIDPIMIWRAGGRIEFLKVVIQPSRERLEAYRAGQVVPDEAAMDADETISDIDEALGEELEGADERSDDGQGLFVDD